MNDFHQRIGQKYPESFAKNPAFFKLRVITVERALCLRRGTSYKYKPCNVLTVAVSRPVTRGAKPP